MWKQHSRPSLKRSQSNDYLVPDQFNIFPLACMPVGFCLFAVAMEPSKFVRFTIVYWHTAFLIACVISCRKPTLAILLGLSTLVVPLFIEETPFLRSIHSTAWLAHMLRLVAMVDNVEYFRHRSFGFRIAFVHYFHDLRWAVQRDTRPEFFKVIFHTILSICTAFAADFALSEYMHTRGAREIIVGLPPALFYTSRWFLGITKCLYMMYTIDFAYRFPLLVLGMVLPGSFHHPYDAKTLKEFWGERYNLVLGRMLKDGIFLPLHRRGYTYLGIILTFAGSATFQLLPFAHYGMRFDIVLPLFLFYAIQLFYLQLERIYKLNGSKWLAFALLPTCPLFIEPMLQSFELLVID